MIDSLSNSDYFGWVAMKAIEIINEAYRIAQIVSAEGETLTSSQELQGLSALNDSVDMINIDGEEISLISNETFLLTQNQSYIDLQNYNEVRQVEYFLGGIRQKLTLVNAEEYYQSAMNSQMSAYAQRTTSGIRLRLYFASNVGYSIEVHGFKNLVNVTIDSDLDATSKFYIGYLKYLVANDLRIFNNLDPLSNIEEKKAYYQSRLDNIKPKQIGINESTLGARGYTLC